MEHKNPTEVSFFPEFHIPILRRLASSWADPATWIEHRERQEAVAEEAHDEETARAYRTRIEALRSAEPETPIKRITLLRGRHNQGFKTP